MVVRGGEKTLSASIYSFFGLVGLLLVLFSWSARKLGSRRRALPDAGVLEDCGRDNVSHLPQIRQAFAETDAIFLSQKAKGVLARRVRKERRRVGLTYLAALQGDFQSLLRMAKIIAQLSPEVAAVHEFERLRLAVLFSWRYQMIRLQLRAGLAPLPRLDSLSDLVSGLSVRMETAIKELGERAALAAEMASSFDRRGTGAA